MTKPSNLEFFLVALLAVLNALFQVPKYGWWSFLENHTVFGGMVAGWMWCLIFHRKVGAASVQEKKG